MKIRIRKGLHVTSFGEGPSCECSHRVGGKIFSGAAAIVDEVLLCGDELFEEAIKGLDFESPFSLI
jgi:hypothetical protein